MKGKSQDGSRLSLKKEIYFQTDKILDWILQGKLKIPSSPSRSLPVEETTLLLEGYSKSPLKEGTAKMKDITHFVDVKPMDGRTKRCGPFRRSSGFLGLGPQYGKKFYVNVSLFDLHVKIRDRSGKVLQEKIFLNNRCPSSINMKNPVSTLRYDKTWKNWITEVVTGKKAKPVKKYRRNRYRRYRRYRRR